MLECSTRSAAVCRPGSSDQHRHELISLLPEVHQPSIWQHVRLGDQQKPVGCFFALLLRNLDLAAELCGAPCASRFTAVSSDRGGAAYHLSSDLTAGGSLRQGIDKPDDANRKPSRPRQDIKILSSHAVSPIASPTPNQCGCHSSIRAFKHSSILPHSSIRAFKHSSISS